MFNPDQQKAPESKSEKSINNMRDLSLLAEFLGDRMTTQALKAKGSITEKGRRKEADIALRAAEIIKDYADDGMDIDVALSEIEESIDYYEKKMGEDISDEEADKAEAERDAYMRVLEFITQNLNIDFYKNTDFSEWLKKQKEAKIARDQDKERAKREEDTATAEKIYTDLGVPSPSEFEKSREKATEIVLKNGGIRIHTSVEKSLSSKGYHGFQNLETRFRDYQDTSATISKIGGDFITSEEWRKGANLNDTLKQRGINELVDIRHETKEIIREVPVKGKKGVMGFGKTADTTRKEGTGEYETILHSEVVENGKPEPAVRLTYYVPPGNEWRDYSGRTGQMLLAEMILPESEAEEIEQIINKDPSAIRTIVKQVMEKKLLKNPKAWEEKQGSGDSLKPPYEKWKSKSGIYIQKEGMQGYDESAFHRI